MHAAGRVCLLFAGLVLFSHSASAADLKAPVARSYADAPAAACLRWVWQQYSWYDDCWAQRHPYVGRSVRTVGPFIR